MEILIKEEKPVFSSGITLEEHKAKIAKIYETKVRPQIEARRNAKTGRNELTAVQKAHLNCKSPI